MVNLTADEITNRIKMVAAKYGSRNPQQLKQLHFALSHSDRRETYRGLINVFRENDFASQEIAGRLLMGLKPKCFDDLPQAVHSILGTWNASVEELPYYFATKFGKTELIRVLATLEKEPHTERELQAIKTFRFWLGGIT
jgi:hypothetical protein